MNRWTYVINEVSPGCYTAEAIRDSHHSIECKGFESIIPEILRESFQMEMSFGTNPGAAAFHVTKGFKSFWSSIYSQEAYGSWTVEDIKTRYAVEYDAKDSCILMVPDRQKAESAFWSGRLPDLLKADCDYFEKLVHFH